MSVDPWELAVHENADPNAKVIGVVLFDGSHIVGFVSHYDFKDTDFSGKVSFGEEYFGSLGPVDIYRSAMIVAAMFHVAR